MNGGLSTLGNTFYFSGIAGPKHARTAEEARKWVDFLHEGHENDSFFWGNTDLGFVSAKVRNEIKAFISSKKRGVIEFSATEVSVTMTEPCERQF